MGWNYLSIHKLQRLHLWSLGMDKYFHPIFYKGCGYLFMLGLKLIHASKRGHRSLVSLRYLTIGICLENHDECIYIYVYFHLHHVSTMRWHMPLKTFLAKDKDPCILLIQYPGSLGSVATILGLELPRGFHDFIWSVIFLICEHRQNTC